MRLPDDVFATLKAERARFGAQPTDEELGVLLNRVAWAHRDAGFGLSGKVGGTTVPFPGGGTICHDVLQLRDGTAWDVLLAAGEGATPVQGDSFLITDPARPWVAPVDPGTPPAPKPPAPEPPIPEPPLAPVVEALAAQVAALEARVETLEAAPPIEEPEPFDPARYEAAGKVWLWTVRLPLRRRS